MKKMAFLLLVLGLLLALYSIAGKYVGKPTISLYGLVNPAKSAAGVLTANTILLLALLVAIKDKLKALGNLLGFAGVIVFGCAVAGRMIGVQTISFLGTLAPIQAGTLLVGSNVLLVLACILAVSSEKK